MTRLVGRQWSLVDNPDLRYSQLNEFDRQLQRLEQQHGWLAAEQGHVFTKHEMDKVIVFERAGLLFCFNFHPNQSLPDYTVPVSRPGEYTVLLDTDWGEVGLGLD